MFQLLILMVSKLILSQSVYEGPVSIDYFKQSFNVSSIAKLPELRCWDEWKEWNNGNKYNTHFGRTNVSDISYTFFDETNVSNPIQYYKINITSTMKEKYKSTLHVTTACGLGELCLSAIYPKIFWNATLSQCGIYSTYKDWMRYHGYDKNYDIHDINAHYNEYCGYDASLDTVMYILYNKKGRVNLIESKDDCLSSDNCIISTKSVIDLKKLQQGVFIVGVGGYGTEYGKYEIQLTCVQVPYPITMAEINPHQIASNLGEISCGLTLHNQSWTNNAPVVYYALNITETTYFPFTITICVYEDFSFDAYIIEMNKLGLNYDVIIKMDHSSYDNRTDSSICLHHHENYGMPAVITIRENVDNILVGNMYWIMLQPFINHAMDFSIFMQCHDPPTPSPTKKPSESPTRMPSVSPTRPPTIPPKIPKALVMGLVFGTCGTLIILFIAYYIYKWKEYIDKRKKYSSDNSDGKSESPSVRTPLKSKFPQEDSEESDNNNLNSQQIELAGFKKVSQQISEDDEKENEKTIGTDQLQLQLQSPKREGSNVSIRALQRNKTVGEQLAENEDVVQLILSDVIQSCIDQSGFDIYQVLALRYCNIESHNIIARKPFTAIGINIELIELSPFITTTFSAIIVGLTQTFGISMVIYKLFTGYFSDGNIFDEICLMDEERWNEVFSLKILSFLLSLVITLFIGGLINGVKHDGLYEIMAKLSLKHMERIPNISFWILQLGQGINYYTCFWAVIGSYWIIFVSNTGELQDDGSHDYSSAGLDMILNAIALFFMLELDDMLVNDQDYDDCQKHLENVLNNYVPDLTINTQYISHNANNNKNNNNNNSGRVDSSHNVQRKFGKCEGYVIPFMYHLINAFSVFVTVCCFGGGFIAPFIIFFCW